MDRRPAQVCWVYAREDESVARELLLLAGVLETQGLIQSWSLVDPGHPDALVDPLTVQRLQGADIVLLLCSTKLVSEWRGVFPDARARGLAAVLLKARGRVVPVLLSPVELPSELSGLQPLPHDGTPLAGRVNRNETLLEITRGIQEIVELRSVVPPPRILEAAFSAPPAIGRPITEVFPLEGPPRFTFVEPPRFRDLKVYLRTMNSGLIVEGPSKVGKSTAVRRALSELGVPRDHQLWWNGGDLKPFDEFRADLDALLCANRDTWLFIDDFHYVEDERYLRKLASVMKILADQEERRAKVTLIGINPLGTSLVQTMPDLGGRFRIVRLDIEKDWSQSLKISELISRGETAANLRFLRRDDFVLAAGGSFFLAQSLCHHAALKSGVDVVTAAVVEIELGPVDVIAAIQSELAAQFRAPLVEFCALDTEVSPKGAGLSLLWLLARRDSDGAVPVREARLRFPMLAAAFDWFLASNLSRGIAAHPRIRGLLYYNRANQTLSMENPQLKFYLRELDWEELARASGHIGVVFHPEDGPLWPITGHVNVVLGDVRVAATGEVTGRAGAESVRKLLHLSDLHFATQDQAIVAYSQLAADLRELGADRLDALVVSGDLVNRAEATEYDAARIFLEKLMSGFGLAKQRVALVPGNHDVSWSRSEDAYRLHRRRRHTSPPPPGTFIAHGEEILEIRDEDAYRSRFQPFADFYRAIKGVEYPLGYEQQGTLDALPEIGVTILGLNSAWECDHHFRDRASIHAEALANALVRLPAPSAGDLRIAVFHHPIHGGEDSRIRDAAFLQQLAVHGFRLALHGHVHKAGDELYRHDMSADGRRLDLVAAGTFGAPTREWVPGYPLQYNLLSIEPARIAVETRCRTEVNGAWGPDARWRQGPGKDPLPRYSIER